MVHIVSKRIKGNEYLYLVESRRKNGKVSQKTIKYIGRKRPISKEEFDCMKFSHSEEDWILNYKDELSYQLHEELKKCSENNKEYFNSIDKISREKEKEGFLSKFIANSNAIEGSTMTVKETQNYLFNELSPEGHPKKELFMATNMLKAWKYLEKCVNRLPKKEDLLKLHSMINNDIEEDKTLGKYKKTQNYVDNEYTCSFLFVEEKMEKLLHWILVAFKKMNEFEVVFQSHVQFEIIHPFIDGNGRVGRLLINWLLMHKNLAPLTVRTSKRSQYISALNNSRKGKKEAIVKFLYEEYRNQYSFI